MLAVPALLLAGGIVAAQTGLLGFNLADLFSHHGVTPREIPAGADPGLALYRNPKTHDRVVGFFSQLAGSPTIATTILAVANKQNVPLALAFALAWKESNFSPTAINYNGGSVDRGLYQLNSLSFPSMTTQSFFDPETNAQEGLSYLSKCLKLGGNEIVGLAMYNAGMGQVVSNETPRETLDYISTVLDYQTTIEGEFESAMVKSGMSPNLLARTDGWARAEF